MDILMSREVEAEELIEALWRELKEERALRIMAESQAAQLEEELLAALEQ